MERREQKRRGTRVPRALSTNGLFRWRCTPSGWLEGVFMKVMQGHIFNLKSLYDCQKYSLKEREKKIVEIWMKIIFIFIFKCSESYWVCVVRFADSWPTTSWDRDRLQIPWGRSPRTNVIQPIVEFEAVNTDRLKLYDCCRWLRERTNSRWANTFPNL